jgi:ribosome-binding protein aMBF1 (putative translation factor)
MKQISLVSVIQEVKQQAPSHYNNNKLHITSKTYHFTMDQQQRQQQNDPQAHSPLPAGGGTTTGGFASNPLGQQQGNAASSQHVLPAFGVGGPGMNAQIIGQLMTNPALAAAAAASPLFPPAAMLTNPSAFYTIPEYYRSQGAVQNDHNARESAAAISNAVAVQAQLISAGQSNQQNGAFPLGNLAQMQQQQQSQQQQQQHGVSGHSIFPMASAQHTIMPYGAVMPPPGLVPNQLAPSSVQAHLAATAAASQAIAGAMSYEDSGIEVDDGALTGKGKRKKDLTASERAKQNRERNREHAKSTRLRKKAYIQKLKELVEGLHAERTEEVRQRRVAIQHLAEMQNVRRAVIRSFLRYHSNYERDKRKWETILEDSFWLKQPVTPYRCFRRSEIEQVRKQ